MMILSQATTRVGGAAQFITVFLVFILVLALTYFTTRWVGTYQKKQSFNRNFEVIETCKITANKYLQIVRAGNKYLVIAIGKDSVTMLTELEEAEIEFPQQMDMTDNFQKIFDKAKAQIHKRSDNK